MAKEKPILTREQQRMKRLRIRKRREKQEKEKEAQTRKNRKKERQETGEITLIEEERLETSRRLRDRTNRMWKRGKREIELSQKWRKIW